MIFNMKEQPEQIEGIKVVDRILLSIDLGIEIDNKRNISKYKDPRKGEEISTHDIRCN